MECVIPDTPEVLRAAVESFVAAKRALSDRDTKPPGFKLWQDTVCASTFVDGSIPGDYACWPSSTLRVVLPFFEERQDLKLPSRRAQVPVRSVVGSSYKWHENSLPRSAHTVDEAIAMFIHRSCAEEGGMVANVCLIKPLGLFYVSGEGKNRVAFLARHGVELMPCCLTEQDYPAADRMILIAAHEGPLRTWLCVLNSNLVTTIPYPEFTLPILLAYGVQVGTWRGEWPMLATVMNSFRLQQSDRDQAMRCGPTSPVILGHLRSRESQTRSESMSPPLALVCHPMLDRKVSYLLSALFAIGVVLFVAVVLLFLDSSLSGLFGGLGLGGLIGTAAMLGVPVRVRTRSLSRAEVALAAADSCAGIPSTAGTVSG